MDFAITSILRLEVGAELISLKQSTLQLLSLCPAERGGLSLQQTRLQGKGGIGVLDNLSRHSQLCLWQLSAYCILQVRCKGGNLRRHLHRLLHDSQKKACSPWAPLLVAEGRAWKHRMDARQSKLRSLIRRQNFHGCIFRNAVRDHRARPEKKAKTENQRYKEKRFRYDRSRKNLLGMHITHTGVRLTGMLIRVSELPNTSTPPPGISQ